MTWRSRPEGTFSLLMDDFAVWTMPRLILNDQSCARSCRGGERVNKGPEDTMPK
jgi:hypothetical protein